MTMKIEGMYRTVRIFYIIAQDKGLLDRLVCVLMGMLAK